MFERQQVLLSTTLDFLVPLKILEYQQAGYLPSRQEIETASQMLSEKGDQLMFKGKETTKVLNQVVKGIATLAFCPGGITLFGIHFEAKMPDSCTE